MIYLLCAAVATSTAGINSTLGSFPRGVFILLAAIPDLSLSDLLAIGCIVTVIEHVRSIERRSDIVKVLYRVTAIAISMVAAYMAYQLISRIGSYNSFPAALIFSSLALLFCCRLITGLLPHEATSPLDLCEMRFRRLLPWAIAAAYIAAMVRCASLYTGFHAGLISLPLLLVVGRGCRALLAAKERHNNEMRELYERSVEALAVAVDAKDGSTNSHVSRVQTYAQAVGRQLALSSAELEALQVAALLHDVGKLAIPEYILLKPGPLTPEEWEKMQTHADLGAQMIERMKFPDAVAAIIKAHHEKWDGTGYPVRLSHSDIPIGARILSAVDALDALASDRPYRRALSLKDAMDTIREEAGKSFDPQVVAALSVIYHELERPGPEMAANKNRPPAFEGSAPASVLNPIMTAALESRLLQRLAEDLGHALTLEEVFAHLENYLRQTIPVDTIGVYIRREERLEPIYVGGAHERLFSRQPFAVSSGGPSGWVAQHRAPILNADPALESCYRNDSIVVRKLLSMVGVPFEGRDGMAGVLAIYHGSRDAFTREHLRVLQAAGAHVGMAAENALKYHDAESSAETDQLTGLFNARSLRMHLERELSRATRDGSSLAVLVCDLDGFKQVNDGFGHLKGNEVLRVFAQLLREASRDSDYLFRMGGDEFVILQPGIREEGCTPQIERLRSAAIEAGWRACGEECLSISVGAAFFPGDGLDAEALLDEADRRMYVSKRAHKLLRNRKLEHTSQEAAFSAEVTAA